MLREEATNCLELDHRILRRGGDRSRYPPLRAWQPRREVGPASGNERRGCVPTPSANLAVPRLPQIDVNFGGSEDDRVEPAPHDDAGGQRDEVTGRDALRSRRWEEGCVSDAEGLAVRDDGAGVLPASEDDR